MQINRSSFNKQKSVDKVCLTKYDVYRTNKASRNTGDLVMNTSITVEQIGNTPREEARNNKPIEAR